MSAHHLTREWRIARNQARERDAYRCRECGKAGILEVHHIQSLQHGGDDDLENLITLCRGCHIDKHRKPRTKRQIEWDGMIRELIET